MKKVIVSILNLEGVNDSKKLEIIRNVCNSFKDIDIVQELESLNNKYEGLDRRMDEFEDEHKDLVEKMDDYVREGDFEDLNEGLHIVNKVLHKKGLLEIRNDTYCLPLEDKQEF